MASNKTQARAGAAGPSRKKSSTKSRSSGSASAKSKSRSRRRKLQPVNEPLPARALQLLFLAMGVLLLLGALIGLRWGLVLAGAVTLISAFPPLRRHVDKWLVGKSRGDEANQAAILRMGVGIVVLLISFVVIL